MESLPAASTFSPILASLAGLAAWVLMLAGVAMALGWVTLDD